MTKSNPQAVAELLQASLYREILALGDEAKSMEMFATNRFAESKEQRKAA